MPTLKKKKKSKHVKTQKKKDNRYKPTDNLDIGMIIIMIMIDIFEEKMNKMENFAREMEPIKEFKIE